MEHLHRQLHQHNPQLNRNQSKVLYQIRRVAQVSILRPGIPEAPNRFAQLEL